MTITHTLYYSEYFLLGLPEGTVTTTKVLRTPE
jgi:hypothetical protein